MPIIIPTLDFAALIPILAIITTGLVVLLLDIYVEDKAVLGYVSLIGLLATAIACFGLLTQTVAPTFQNMLVSDGYSLVLDLIFVVTATLSIMIALSYLPARDMQSGEYYALLLFATSGMMLMGAATDLIVVFLGLEIMSIALYVLAAFNRRQLGSGEAGLKYFVLGAFASAFFLYGVALTYGATGSTNLQTIAMWFSANPAYAHNPIAMVGLALLLIGFAFKIAAVPFQWWTPDVYHGAPTSVTAFMSVGAKAAGFAALVRLLLVSFGAIPDWRWVISWLAVLTMTGGNIVALAQKDVKRMLAYSSIAHAGYILVGVVPGTPDGVKGILFYLMSYAFMNIGAFAVIALLEQRDQIGSSIESYMGLSSRKPLLALMMLFFMFSLTGIPPFIGFWGKWYVFWAAVKGGASWLAIVGMINSVISAFYYLSVVVQMYMRSPTEPSELEFAPLSLPVTLTIALAGAVTLLLGLWPTPLIKLTALGIFG